MVPRLQRAPIGGDIFLKPAKVELHRFATEFVAQVEGAAPRQILFETRGAVGGMETQVLRSDDFELT